MAIDPTDRYQLPDDFKRALLNSKSKTQRLTGDFIVDPPPDVPDIPAENKKEKKSEPKRKSPAYRFRLRRLMKTNLLFHLRNAAAIGVSGFGCCS